MNQTKLESLIESLFNTMSGFLLSWLAWIFVVAPYFGIPFEWTSSIGVTIFFTFLSLFRNYVIRRMFANGFHEAAKDLAKKILKLSKGVK